MAADFHAGNGDSPQLSRFAGTGRTPSGLARRIMACLRDRIPDLPEIHVTVVGGTVAIRGNAGSRHEKWLYLECCRRVPGVIRVIDELVGTDEFKVEHDPEETLS